jgi:hypothetical protein
MFTYPTVNKTLFISLTKEDYAHLLPSPKHSRFNKQSSFFGVPTWRVLAHKTMKGTMKGIVVGSVLS